MRSFVVGWKVRSVFKSAIVFVDGVKVRSFFEGWRMRSFVGGVDVVSIIWLIIERKGKIKL